MAASSSQLEKKSVARLDKSSRAEYRPEVRNQICRAEARFRPLRMRYAAINGRSNRNDSSTAKKAFLQA